MKRFENAVLDNMLHTRFRNWRPVVLITLYSMMLLVVIGLVMIIPSAISGSFDTNSTGAALYYVLTFLQFGLIVVIMPAITAGMVSGERERKTLDLLMCTQMTPLGIVLGKLLSGCLFMGLCVVCSVPMIVTAYLYGGVNVVSVLCIVAVYLVTIIAIGSLGVFFSSIFKRTTTAVVVTYLSVFFLGTVSTVGGYVQLGIDSYLHQGINNYIPAYPAFWIINPSMALLEVTGTGGSSVMGTLISLVGQGQWPVMWGWELLTLLLLSALLIFLSARILSPRRGWLTWKKNGTAAAPVKQ